MVWERVRGRKLKGFTFPRQHSFGEYILEFYCAEASLVVELDGMTHTGRDAYDTRRHAGWKRRGLRAMRFTNQQFLESYEAFFAAVADECLKRTKQNGMPFPPNPSPRPSPRSTGARERTRAARGAPSSQAQYGSYFALGP